MHFHPLMFLMAGVGVAAFVLFFAVSQPKHSALKKRVEILESKMIK